MLTLLASTAIITVGKTALARAEKFSHSETKVYTNINGNFSMSDVYNYSSGDKFSEQHKTVFTLNSNNVNVDGKIVTVDAAPYVNEGRMMVPLRAITDIFGKFGNRLGVSWNSEDKKITVICDYKEIVFTIGNNEYTVNGERRHMSGGAAENRNGWTYIPVRIVADTLGLHTDWNSTAKTIIITN